MGRPATLASASILALLFCVNSSRAGTPPVKLIVQPATLEMDGSADRQRLLVTAVMADGRQVDATSTATYASREPGIVAVSPAGECEPRGDGRTEVTVSYQGQSVNVAVAITNSKSERAPSFVNDVLPILTRLGCNQGSCHGKNAGQNGFRLSLRGYAPEMDHPWLTREFSGRRIDPAVPENSLLLRKPLGVASHEGGKVMQEGSREHRVLLDWIRTGAPAALKEEAEIRRLEVLPGNRILRVGQEQQLLARAEYSDGRLRDVSWLAKFESNDAGTIDVSPTGLAKVLRSGETSIRVTFQGQVGVVVLTAPHDRPVKADLYSRRNNVVDEHVFNKLAALRIEPSELSSDEEFLRRAFLDTIGTLPTAAEVRTFLADKHADKRAKAIDALLERPEFVDYWAVQLGDLFQNRRERDHDVRGTKGVRAFHDWLRHQLAANRPWDELCRDVLTASGTSSENPAIGYYVVTVGEKREAEKSEVVASVAQAFLGTRIGCAQCHNHPLEKYTQDDYYHFAGFFSRINFKRMEPTKGDTVLSFAPPTPQQLKNPFGVTQPRTGRFLKPQPLDRTSLTIDPVQDPRTILAAWMTDPKNEYFSGAIVNRLVRHFLGVGLVEPVDDLRASNPPTNPELWQALKREFVDKKFDLKHVMRLILNSRTYQLSSTTRPGNETDTRFYSHYYARRLPAEVLLDALAQSTDVPDSFPGYPLGVRAMQLPEPGLRSYFLSLFGRSERVTACACERSGEVTMPQLLHLQNGQSVVQKVRAADGRLSGLLKAKLTDAQITEELFLVTLGRLPTPAQVAAVQKSLAEDNRDEVFRDLFWALLNSKEFAFNH